MNLSRFALALAASAMLAGAAAAQPSTSATDPAMPADATQPPADTTPADHMPADTAAPAPAPADMAAPAATSSGTDVSATQPLLNVELATMQPIPDTKENRSKYGQPLSRAGKRTAAKGN